MRGASLLGAFATLALGLGCIDVSLIKSTSGAGGGGGVGGKGGVGVTGAAGAAAACFQPGVKQDLGAVCGCDGDCASGFCVEGVCCGSACTNGCQTCAAQGLLGICVQRSTGAAPRRASDCPADSPASCGLDGTCDGAGSCHFYLGNTCVGGSCSGAAVVGAYVCDGMGQCKPGVSVMLCTPYTCDSVSGTCFTGCTDSSECNGHACDIASGSCGKTAAGAHCADGADCLTGFCADHVCCNIACAGACVACNLSGRLGACSPVDSGKPDPRGVCTDNGVATCGHDGTCDGIGGCANYPKDSQCLNPSCTSNRLNTPGTCDGLGTCRAPGVLDCSPFRCVDGACTDACSTEDDCDAGHACVQGTCGPKPLGLSCGSGGECVSNYCVDGVCCNSACAGVCVSCALPGSPGQCTAVAADNPDPRGGCPDQGAASCGTNGRCDGNSACAHYVAGTVCAAASCTSNAYTQSSTCSGAGQCVAPGPLSCAPYTCGGAQCAVACVTDDQCVAGTVCVSNSCGLKRQGAACSSSSECLTGLSCSQGFCCDSVCSGKCQSCGVSGAVGTCTNVPSGAADPSGQCQTQGQSSCGTNGKCDGNSACALVGGVSCPTN